MTSQRTGYRGCISSKGEVRLAHYGPDTDHKNGRGVFGRLIPSTLGVTFTRRRKNFAHKRTPITAANFEDILKAASARRDWLKDWIKGSEKVAPDKPGTVSGGQVRVRTEGSTNRGACTMTIEEFAAALRNPKNRSRRRGLLPSPQASRLLGPTRLPK